MIQLHVMSACYPISPLGI